LKAAGLTWADLRNQGRESPQLIATYDYTDETGKLLYQVCRYKPKDFRQRRPDGQGKWIWNLGAVRRVLFGLPELSRQRVVYVVEGEKDVFAVRKLGLTATTNAGGAGKWRDEYPAQMRALGIEYVVILPDNDDIGRKHAELIGRS